MRHIDADTITQAVIARYAAAGDARLREVMTSLVQHLHAFARDVRLTEAEWAEGLRFLADSGREAARGRPEVALLSDSLGLTALVTAVNQRKPRGCTETTLTVPWPANGVPYHAGGLSRPTSPVRSPDGRERPRRGAGRYRQRLLCRAPHAVAGWQPTLA